MAKETQTIEVTSEQLELSPKGQVLPAILPETATQMLAIVAARGGSVDEISKWMDLEDRWKKGKAKTAFVQGMNAFKKNPPTIIRDRKSEHGKYAGLDTICKAVMGALSEQGISHRWEYEQTGPEWINVTCILTHEDGHSESTKMGGPPDATGPKGNATKNPIHAIASTRTYLERYTLLGAVGLESAYDDDGNGGEGMTNGELTDQLDELERCETLAGLEAAFKAAATQALDVKKDVKAYATLKEAKNKRKAVLSCR